MKKTFEGKVVWITGASSGIGYHLAKEFYNAGAILAISARRIDRLNNLALELGKNVKIYELDVQNKAQVFEVAQQIAQDFGKIDVAIANAGFGVVGEFEKITEHEWRNLFDTNFFGVVWTIQAALPFLKQTKGSACIISSVSSFVATFNTAAYSASKAALMGMANALYQEMKPLGVSVSAIYPGLVESEIAMVDNEGHFHENRKDKRPKKFMWKGNDAAKEILKAILLRKREAIITTHAKVAVFLVKYFPKLFYYLLSKAQFTSRRQ